MGIISETESFIETEEEFKQQVIVGDLHSGRFNNDFHYLQDNLDYFDKFLIPYIKSLSEPLTTRVVIMGDLFDNKQITSNFVQSMIADKIEELALLCYDVVIETGNHDTQFEEHIEHSAIKLFKFMPKVIVVGKKFLKCNNTYNDQIYNYCSYQSKASKLKAIIDLCDGGSYFFGHNSIYGFKYEGIPVPENGHLSVEDFKKFTGVFMGHIHMRQTIKQINFVGSGLHCRQVEYKNKKIGIDLLKSDGTTEFIENKISPKYKRMGVIDFLDFTLAEATEFCRGSFVKVMTPSSLHHLDYSILNKILSEYRSFEVKSYFREKLDSLIEANDEKLIDIKEINLDTDYFKKYIEQLSMIVYDKKNIDVSKEDKEYLLEKLTKIKSTIEVEEF